MKPGTTRLRHLATLRNSNVDKKTREGEEAVRLCNYTDVYYGDTIDAASDFMNATATPQEISRFTLRESQVLMTKDSESADDIGVSAYVPHDMHGVVCGYHLTQITPGNELSGRFLHWSLTSHKLRAWFEVSARGVTRFALGQEAIGNAPIPSPPIKVQRRIADFLDRETERIDALVDKKRRLIDLLEEKRTATITQAVTKGLDPTVPMKPSGIPWIGEIPEHWEATPLMRLVPSNRKIMYGIVLPGPDVDEGIPIIKSGNVRPGRLHPDRLDKTTYEIEARHVRSRVHPGDIVYSIRGSVGDAELVPDELELANLTQDAARVAPDMNVTGPWLVYALQCGSLFSQLESKMTGAAIKGINIRDLRRLGVPTPPRKEQQRIAMYLDDVGDAVTRAENMLTTQLSLLAEYREALITAAVTGEIDADEFDADRQMARTS